MYWFKNLLKQVFSNNVKGIDLVKSLIEVITEMHRRFGIDWPYPGAEGCRIDLANRHFASIDDDGSTKFLSFNDHM